jgi:hypothetical protein
VSRPRASRRRLGTVAALALAGLLTVLAIGSTGASGAAVACPTFRVLHNDRVGPASFPAGTYSLSPEAGLSCTATSALFARFLEDYDGVLPRPWRVVPGGSGKAGFSRGAQPGFAVSRIGGGGGGGNTALGMLCSGTFTVNAGSRVGPLSFPRGQYLVYIPSRSGITCRRASILFTRFLAAPGGTLPFPWRLKNQTATFYKPANPLRSAFRIEPLNGT